MVSAKTASSRNVAFMIKINASKIAESALAGQSEVLMREVVARVDAL